MEANITLAVIAIIGLMLVKGKELAERKTNS